MAESIAALVERVGLALRPPPVVSVEEYRAITCNRCGVCCEDIRAYLTPEELAAQVADASTDVERRGFLDGLIPVEAIGDAWQYRCRYFERDAKGLGGCGIFETRPAVCRGFPYGRVVRCWPQCAWNVEVRDAEGNRIELVLPVDTAAEGEVRNDDNRTGQRTDERRGVARLCREGRELESKPERQGTGLSGRDPGPRREHGR